MTGYNAWLNTELVAEQRLIKEISSDLPVSPVIDRVYSELERAFGQAVDGQGRWRVELSLGSELTVAGGYRLSCRDSLIELTGADEAGILYACYAFIKKVMMGEMVEGLVIVDEPKTELRMINHWDNMDGSIERGYSGESFFFENNEIILNQRTEDYCRLAASVGINAIAINNVNVKNEASLLITPRHFERLAGISELFHSFGIALYLSLNYAAPIEVGGLSTADPLDQTVIAWWDQTVAEIYKALPLLGGFLVKADSEGRPGPFTYGRNQAEGANLLGRALKPYGGTLIWRAFVYNAQQDWRDTKTDRARAAFDYFSKLDGQFLDNVYLQIKNGPVDFQVREPVSPLFSAMTRTNIILELQIAQEYTGQQIDLCYLAPQWREILDFQTANPAVVGEDSSLAKIVMGQALPRVKVGIAAVSNTGNDENWFGNDLAGLNFYSFGGLAWSADRSSESMAQEWAALTLGLEGRPAEDLVEMLMASWAVYEAYTAPLGIGWMVTPHTHYGPSVDGYEYDRWGTYHRADLHGIGIDRSDSGTGYAGLYPGVVADVFNHKESCPDAYVLFYHRMAYTDSLKSGKTVIQHIYDSRFWGHEQVMQFIVKWDALEPKLDAALYQRVRSRFERQLNNAVEWRDQVNSYFWRKSGIADELGRRLY